MAYFGYEDVEDPHENSVKGVALVNALLGIAIIGVAFLAVEPLMFWNAAIVGGLVLLLALWNAWVAFHHETDRVAGPAAVNVLLGLWLAASPFVLPLGTFAVFWASVTLGLLVAVLAAYNTWAGYQDRRPYEEAA